MVTNEIDKKSSGVNCQAFTTKIVREKMSKMFMIYPLIMSEVPIRSIANNINSLQNIVNLG